MSDCREHCDKLRALTRMRLVVQTRLISTVHPLQLELTWKKLYTTLGTWILSLLIFPQHLFYHCIWLVLAKSFFLFSLKPMNLRHSSFFFFFCSGFCHTLKWNSHGFTCVPHPDPPSHLLLHPLPLGLPSAPGPSACLMHPTWAGDLFHPI